MHAGRFCRPLRRRASYELRAIERQGRPGCGRPSRPSAPSRAAGRFHIDTVDFYLSRSRRIVHRRSGEAVRETVEVIEADVNRLIGQVEAYAQKQLAEASARPCWCRTRTRPRR